jgi:HK97 family phage major capsid protein
LAANQGILAGAFAYLAPKQISGGDHMSVIEIRALQAERAEKINQLDEMAKRQLTPEEQTAFDDLVMAVSDLDARVVAIEDSMNSAADVQQNSTKLETLKRSNKKAPAMNIPAIVTDLDDKKAKRNKANAVRGFFLKGTRGFRSEYASAANEVGLDLNSNEINLEARAQGVGSTGIGGALVNDEFYGSLTQAMRDYNAVRQVATVLSTSNGSSIQMPCLDDTSNSGSLIAENGSISEVALTFTNKTMGAYKFSSGQVLTSYELLQDSLIDVESLVAEQAGIRLGRIQESFFTTGSGSSQPQGLVIGAAAGKTAAATNAITVDDIIDLVFSVDTAYKTTGNVGFMCHPSILAAIAKLKDTNGSPIFAQNYAGADARVPTIMGYPVTLNSNMASSLSAAGKVLLFGDFSKYVVRDVAGDGGITIVRQSETYATSGQIGWVAIARSSGLLLTANATTYNPVKYLIMAAS